MGTRPRHRHVAFRVEADRSPTRGEMAGAIRAVFAGLHGRDALDAAEPWLTVFQGDRGLVRVAHTHDRELIEALRRIRWVGDEGNRCTVTTLGTSGTIRAARERYLGAPGAGEGD